MKQGPKIPIEVTFRHLGASDALRARAEKKISGLLRLVPGATDAHTSFSALPPAAISTEPRSWSTVPGRIWRLTPMRRTSTPPSTRWRPSSTVRCAPSRVGWSILRGGNPLPFAPRPPWRRAVRTVSPPRGKALSDDAYGHPRPLPCSSQAGGQDQGGVGEAHGAFCSRRRRGGNRRCPEGP